MSSSGNHSSANPARHQGSLLRQLTWYFGGLIGFYLIGLAMFWPEAGQEPSSALFTVLMFAPTVGALLAWLIGRGRIQWGRPNWWVLAGLTPAVVGLAAYLVASALGWVELAPSILAKALLLSPVAILSGCLSAIGEEIGWRGFLWPLLRARWGFWMVSLVVGVIWWGYHLPLIIFGWYGSLAGLPAFTVAIVGYVLFDGVLTDRSKGIWPSVIAHGSWNGLVATSFAALSTTPAFTGDERLLGEFGWLAAVGMLTLGVLAAAWHTRTTGGPLAATQAPVTGSVPPTD
jgi:membrane protease YdiL (CAAX protease family)